MYTIIQPLVRVNVSLLFAVEILNVLAAVWLGDYRREPHPAAVGGQEFGGVIRKLSKDFHIPFEVLILGHDLAKVKRGIVDLIVAGRLFIRKLQVLR